ncbi:hypothetical protein BO99DRAFT_437062 [Aspergillus violaceofuscus CBS 115571]|uniref:Uncharacterized protein n=1 Tax=Aspergillus violaceofuscus (strain CBS 115571) TaxID=1450538 RepID=A0A2V5GTS7_ASPV1|nr:hypothetical protein BO99DRAFT_437062 [Aspergillus violaceofuscus CBS 115571]
MAQASTPKPLLDFVHGRRDVLDHPLLWTLRCHFDDLKTSAYSESAPKDAKGTADAEALAHPKGPTFTSKAGRSTAHLIWRSIVPSRETPLDNSSPPLVGYVHYTDINGDRIDHCEGLARASRVPGRRQNLLALTTPKDWTEDPYFLYLLLALAQRQHVLRLRSPGPGPESHFMSRLLVTHALDQESILFCEAAITTEILDALGNLKSAAMRITWPMIHRKMIPHKPYDTFAGRLRDQLVESSPSKFVEHVNDATSYETKRRQGVDDGEDGSGPRKVRRISGT